MSDVDNDRDRETDEWLVPADLRAPRHVLSRDGGEAPRRESAAQGQGTSLPPERPTPLSDLE